MKGGRDEEKKRERYLNLLSFFWALFSGSPTPPPTHSPKKKKNKTHWINQSVSWCKVNNKLATTLKEKETNETAVFLSTVWDVTTRREGTCNHHATIHTCKLNRRVQLPTFSKLAYITWCNTTLSFEAIAHTAPVGIMVSWYLHYWSTKPRPLPWRSVAVSLTRSKTHKRLKERF